MAYWRAYHYDGVRDEVHRGGRLEGRLVARPHVCFEVEESELQHEGGRTHGAKLAVQDWGMVFHTIESHARNMRQWPDLAPLPEFYRADAATAALRRLLGITVHTKAEFREWWDDNRDYVRWSSEQEMLVVDREAKSSGIPLLDLRVHLAPEKYWYWRAMGQLTQVEKGDLLLISVMVPPDGGFVGWISSSVQTDCDAKERGYLEAVEGAISYFVFLRTDGQWLGEGQAKKTMVRLRSLTDQTFQAPRHWERWWTEYEPALVLGPDCERLMTPPAPEIPGSDTDHAR